MSRRLPNIPIALEVMILQFAVDLAEQGDPWLYPYGAARELAKSGQTPNLIGNGTFYKAVRRMEEPPRAWFVSCDEDPEIAKAERRPRRTLYRVTDAGRKALELAPDAARSSVPTRAATTGGAQPSKTGPSTKTRKKTSAPRSLRGAIQGI